MNSTFNFYFRLVGLLNEGDSDRYSVMYVVQATLLLNEFRRCPLLEALGVSWRRFNASFAELRIASRCRNHVAWHQSGKRSKLSSSWVQKDVTR